MWTIVLNISFIVENGMKMFAYIASKFDGWIVSNKLLRKKKPNINKIGKYLSQYIREAYEHKERKGHPQIAWKIQETVSKL